LLRRKALFKHHLEAVDTEAVRDRCVDVEGLAGNARFLVGRHGVERLHVMQAVRELNENDTDVLDHRKHHLAKALGLGFGAAAKLNLVKLADGVDEPGDLGSEVLFNLCERSVCVLDDVVQNCCLNRLRVKMHVGQFLGDSYRMRDIGFARLALLAVMRRCAELVGTHDRLNVLFGQVSFKRFDEVP